MDNIRVLVVPRDDQNSVHGGDALVMSKTREHLLRHGIELNITFSHSLPKSYSADIVYLTFLHQVASVKKSLDWARQKQVPVMISPLFEDQLHLWFQWAMRKPTIWLRLSRIIGSIITRNIYLAWHKRRIRNSEVWKIQRELLMQMFLVPNSYFELNHLKYWFDLPSPRYSIVPLGIDPSVFMKRKITTSLPELDGLTGYVLEVGRLEERKNQLGLIHALNNIDIPILLLGKVVPTEKYYFELCKQAATKRGNVHFVDFIPEDMLPEVYSQAAVHVLPSWSERPGLVTLEAAACGCKVVSTCYSPIPEYLGDDAWYCRPEYSHTIRNAVSLAISSAHPTNLDNRVRKTFTWENTAFGLRKVILELVP